MAQLYCLECNQMVGEDPTGEDADRDHNLEICQSCTQHAGAPRNE